MNLEPARPLFAVLAITPRVIIALATGLCVLCTSQVLAATPPDLLNYQGVLRDTLNQPLNGTYLMTFRFIDANGGGIEILVDTHGDAAGGTVVVTDGLFNVQIGSGTVSDGTGPGVYNSLANVFRDYDNVMLRVEVEGEVLSPDVRVVAAAYAHNATHFAGFTTEQFMRSDVDDLMAGKAWFAGLPVSSSVAGGGVFISPQFADPGDTLLGIAVSGVEKFRIDAEGDVAVGRTLTALGSTNDYALNGIGFGGGGYFEDADGSGQAWVASGGQGISASGASWGGYFADSNDSGVAQVAVAHHGIVASGSDHGGHFSGGTGGIDAFGDSWGGRFNDNNGTGVAYVGYGNRGIEANGSSEGGYFQDLDESGHAYVAKGHRGIEAYGYEMGGFFQDSNHSGYAHIGVGNVGVKGYGDGYGGYFEDSISGAHAYLGDGDYGVRAWTSAPGTGAIRGDHSSGLYSIPGSSNYSTLGNGEKAFVQNHPYDKDKVVRYVSLEGDEAGTYTRGNGRLSNGVARVTLGETFQWVTNPDIGLTAHLTPRGAPTALSVESLSTTELVVRGPEGSDAAFDYVVFGLRIGFEEGSVVADKTIESMIPSMEVNRELFEREPEFREYTALARFEKMAVETGRSTADRSRSKALEASIGRYDPEVHGPVENLLGFGSPSDAVTESSPTSSVAAASVQAGQVREESESDPASRYRERRHDSPLVMASPTLPTLPVSEAVEAGDVLVVDPLSDGSLRRARDLADPTVVGIATGPSRDALAAVAVVGVVECKVDAGYGAIHAGDLLATSPTAGHAMLSLEAAPGTILGKAMQPLDSGTGTIKVLVMPR
jgi:hypothetical protein